uniref:Uncharacterized protein n=1 Tax=Peromyscus maniculatus bairdii TaxID=230844 RepID=A0A8C8ULV3_PERMB
MLGAPVRPGLHLGGAAAVAAPDHLMEAGITAVLTVDSEPGFQAGAGFEGLRSLFVPTFLTVFCLFVLVFRDRVSLCSSGYPGSHFVNQAGLELTEIHLPLPPNC